MITDAGKNIVAKYLIGQAGAYASYIAIGCGAKPLASTNDFAIGGYSSQEALEFEMTRMRIISKGYVVEDNVAKIVLTAELPTEERYEITEIGVYPSATNDLVANIDSKNLLKFGSSEAWTIGGTSTIPTFSSKLLTKISTTTDIPVIFRANSDNAGLNDGTRENGQRPRFLNEAIFIRGNQTSSLQLSDVNIDLSQNSPDDELRLAFSILDDDSLASGVLPHSATISVKFLNGSGQNATYATMNFTAESGVDGVDFSTYRYAVVKKKIGDLVLSDPAFDFKNISKVEVSISVTGANSAASSNFYVALDALRLENLTSFTSLYGLTAYSPIVNVNSSNDAVPVIKKSNTSNFIEFRFNVGV